MARLSTLLLAVFILHFSLGIHQCSAAEPSKLHEALKGTSWIWNDPDSKHPLGEIRFQKDGKLIHGGGEAAITWTTTGALTVKITFQYINGSSGETMLTFNPELTTFTGAAMGKKKDHQHINGHRITQSVAVNGPPGSAEAALKENLLTHKWSWTHAQIKTSVQAPKEIRFLKSGVVTTSLGETWNSWEISGPRTVLIQFFAKGPHSGKTTITFNEDGTSFESNSANKQSGHRLNAVSPSVAPPPPNGAPVAPSLAAPPAVAPPDHRSRVALLIGVSAYRDPHFPPLEGIDKDLAHMSASLHELGFSIAVLTNPTKEKAEAAIDEFGGAIREKKAIGLFYYSGHGCEVEGVNYLIPVGTSIGGRGDVKDQGVNVNRVFNRMEEAGDGSANLLFLDCCRNSFAKGADSQMASMTANGTFIGFATASQKTAAATPDGSVYTNFLAKHLLTPGLSVLDMHTLVTHDVKSYLKANDGDAQIPQGVSGLDATLILMPTRK